MSSAAIRVISPLRRSLLAPGLRLSAFRSGIPSFTTSLLVRDIRRGFSQSSFWQVKKYTDQHEWVELGPDGTTATIGITEFAAKALGDVVYVELPAVDTEVTTGEAIGAVESVKSASDIMSPVSGKIIEANGAVEETPKLINEGPEAQGWIAKIQIADKAELEQLMDEETYKASLGEE